MRDCCCEYLIEVILHLQSLTINSTSHVSKHNQLVYTSLELNFWFIYSNDVFMHILIWNYLVAVQLIFLLWYLKDILSDFIWIFGLFEGCTHFCSIIYVKILLLDILTCLFICSYLIQSLQFIINHENLLIFFIIDKDSFRQIIEDLFKF